MNIQEADILNILAREPYAGQRQLAERSGHSLGMVNRCLRSLAAEGLLDRDMAPTEAARRLLARSAPRNAVILAAGSGMRMAPVNVEVPKGLLEVNGEPLIERAIRQLHRAGIRDVTVVVGFMKEQYEYLIDRYGVTLVVNPDWAAKNNLHSLLLVLDRLSNTYVIPCDIWCAFDPFRPTELYSWYMVSDRPDHVSTVRVNRRSELAVVPPASGGNAMIGIAYLAEPEAAVVRRRIAAMALDPRRRGSFWEDALYEKDKMLVYARTVPADQVEEINTCAQLQDLNSGAGRADPTALSAAAAALGVRPEALGGISLMKKGMTNRSFLLTCRDRRYVLRIPGPGTDRLIDRAGEAAAYAAIRGRGLCDEPLLMDPASGYKLTACLERARTCDASDRADVEKCMALLRSFHGMDLAVERRFDLFERLDFYESLWDGAPSAYRDYRETKANVLSLRDYIEAHAARPCLAHIDPVPDNFLFVPLPGGREELQLIDWEYAGMQDPHVDIAMFGIYALYGREQMDGLIDAYFPEGCPESTRTKIYCYVAVCGLIWSNWCEYERGLGVDFGAYSLRQYRYAKEYYRLARERMEREHGL